ncbi:MAG TPA: gliding motility-associated C-terminal domain-containing protein [Cyclobacteriaceae bacterium]|nr:gliding motility-associated C-terminal domain-containing protein [Cyclobacteriaceae bacterium]
MIFSIVAEAQIISDFTSNQDGWTTPGDADATIQYSATGGNPAGHVYGSPYVLILGATTLYVPYYFVAPGKFTGNRSAYYNGTLRYDVQQSTTGTPSQTAEVAILDNGGVGLYYYPTAPFQPPAPAAWTTFSVRLNNATGFWKTADSPTGPVATEAQLLNILTSLATLEIRGLYRQANVTTRLDNVTLYPPIIINTQPSPSTVCSGLTPTFTTAASNNAAITYRWQRQTAPSVFTDLNNGGGYANVTTAVLSVNTTGNFGAGNYRCRISGTRVDDEFTNAAALIVNSPPAAPTTTGSTSCTSPAVLTLSAAGGAAGQYRWYTVALGGSPLGGQTNSTYTTPSLATTTTYHVAINNGTCESTRTPVTATISSTPAPPTTTGASSCGSGPVLLSASGGSAGQYRWYTTSTGGSPLGGVTNNTYSTPVLSATTTYHVSIINGSCESARTPVTATINTVPKAPAVTGNSICGAGTVALSATGGSAGQYRWYTAATGGTAIAGETSATYNTPAISTTTTYHVSINDGNCESTRTAVTATINTNPTAPVAIGASSCTPASLTLSASGGSNGQYRWYTVPTGGTAITSQVNNTYATPSLTSTTTYYVAINNGTCESTRASVVATIGGTGCGSNQPPVIDTTPASTQIGGTIEIDLSDLISDADNNLDLSTLTIITPPASGATATINNTTLIINYTGIAFTGKENITIGVCDIFAACTQQTFAIEVDGSIEIFNAISPGRDGKNDVFFIENIDKLNDTRRNHVAIYNRWGDLVWEADNYNNASVAFTGKSKTDSDLPSGTYFYKIEFTGSSKATQTGYLALKR